MKSHKCVLEAYTVLFIQSIEKSADKKISVGSLEEQAEDLNSFLVLAVGRNVFDGFLTAWLRKSIV